jgi:hypothetical protein
MDRISELQQEYQLHKPWYVHAATRSSAEDILYAQGKVSALFLALRAKIGFFSSSFFSPLLSLSLSFSLFLSLSFSFFLFLSFSFFLSLFFCALVVVRSARV